MWGRQRFTVDRAEESKKNRPLFLESGLFLERAGYLF
jgi:hypothetical protein